MFIVFLRFTNNKHMAPQFMQSHLDWIKSGINDNAFLLAGGLLDGSGGCIVTHNITESELLKRLHEDPFVIENVVTFDFVAVAVSLAQVQQMFLVS
ncbi:YciI family protein [Pseudoalteromonas sp. T1lg65]|uniref:YciI family protein n=1 Tax=Pseudoalteromonas sp. T1lg65 TaxID=2077101 RepID=UPI003F7ABEA9